MAKLQPNMFGDIEVRTQGTIQGDADLRVPQNRGPYGAVWYQETPERWADIVAAVIGSGIVRLETDGLHLKVVANNIQEPTT